MTLDQLKSDRYQLVAAAG